MFNSEKLLESHGAAGENSTIELPEHSIAQGRSQCSGSKVTDVSPMKTLFSESDTDHHLFIVYV